MEKADRSLQSSNKKKRYGHKARGSKNRAIKGKLTGSESHESYVSLYTYTTYRTRRKFSNDELALKWRSIKESLPSIPILHFARIRMTAL